MREIKFRAWDKLLRKMRNVANIYFDVNGNISNIQFWRDDMKDLGETVNFAYRDIVLMQYTGLKDKNGKEIYDKDIVGFEGDDCNGVVYQEEDGRWMIEWCDGDKTPLILAIKSRDFVVKGNIFETPELFRKEVGK